MGRVLAATRFSRPHRALLSPISAPVSSRSSCTSASLLSLQVVVRCLYLSADPLRANLLAFGVAEVACAASAGARRLQVGPSAAGLSAHLEAAVRVLFRPHGPGQVEPGQAEHVSHLGKAQSRCERASVRAVLQGSSCYSCRFRRDLPLAPCGVVRPSCAAVGVWLCVFPSQDTGIRTALRQKRN